MNYVEASVRTAGLIFASREITMRFSERIYRKKGCTISITQRMILIKTWMDV